MTLPTAPHGYQGAIEIPARKVGNYEVRHVRKPAGFCAQLSNARTAIFGKHMGGRITTVHYDVPTTWHELVDQDGTWMSDYPIEQEQHHKELAPIKGGRVLVGGLGLGVALHILSPRVIGRDPRRRAMQGCFIEKITVVEKSEEVIDLVEKATRKRTGLRHDLLEIVHADLFDYLRAAKDLVIERARYPNPGRPQSNRLEPIFDWAFYDIWRSDGEGTFHDTILPLRRLSTGVIANEPICWNEDVMRGQLSSGLVSRGLLSANGMMDLPPELFSGIPEDNFSAKFVNWSVPFFCWVRDAKPSQERIQKGAETYAAIHGMRDWEKTWRMWMEVEGALRV